MGKQFGKANKILAILLAVFFVTSLTAGAVSASYGDTDYWKHHYKDYDRWYDHEHHHHDHDDHYKYDYDYWHHRHHHGHD
jgi:hypothetical protein